MTAGISPVVELTINQDIQGGKTIMTPARKKAEELIYKYYDAVDTTGTNTAYYKEMFDKMSDAQFKKFCERPLPFRFHTRPWEVDPKMEDIKRGLDVLGVPLTEKVYLPYFYKNSKGEPVTSQPAVVVPIHIKKMKQFAVKKNNTVGGIDERDYKTGLLVYHDKGGKTSDRELEGLIVMGMDNTMKELTTFRADAMNAKSIAYSTIATTGTLKMSEVPVDQADFTSKNTLNYYLLGSCMYTNIVNQDYMLPITVKNRQRRVTRETE